VQLIANQRYHIKAEFLPDGTINTYINGTKTMTAMDTSFITGLIALRSYQAVDIDNLKVILGVSGVGGGSGQSTTLVDLSKQRPVDGVVADGTAKALVNMPVASSTHGVLATVLDEANQPVSSIQEYGS